MKSCKLRTKVGRIQTAQAQIWALHAARLHYGRVGGALLEREQIAAVAAAKVPGVGLVSGERRRHDSLPFRRGHPAEG